MLVTAGCGDEALRTNHPLGSNGHWGGVTVAVFFPTGNPTPVRDDKTTTAAIVSVFSFSTFRRTHRLYNTRVRPRPPSKCPTSTYPVCRFTLFRKRFSSIPVHGFCLSTRTRIDSAGTLASVPSRASVRRAVYTHERLPPTTSVAHGQIEIYFSIFYLDRDVDIS